MTFTKKDGSETKTWKAKLVIDSKYLQKISIC